MSKQTIKVYWYGPFSAEEIIENKIDKEYEVSATDIGLYQIYGSHPIYGDNVLVYIGKTEDNFQKRLKNRWQINDDKDEGNVQIYLGKIFDDAGEILEKTKKEFIIKAEALLINSLKPAYNSSNIQSVKKEFVENDYVLHNYGVFRSLYPVLDSRYFWKIFENYNTVDMLADKMQKTVEEKDDWYGFFLKEEIEDLNIWFGIDDDVWNNNGYPLCIEISSEDTNIKKKIENYKECKISSESDKGNEEDNDIICQHGIGSDFIQKDIDSQIKYLKDFAEKAIKDLL